MKREGLTLQLSAMIASRCPSVVNALDMIGRLLPVRTGAEAIRAIRALGAHRYVSGCDHSIHALVFDALSRGRAAEAIDPKLQVAAAWAHATLSDPTIERDSKDPRLVRKASAEELLVVLEGFWVPGTEGDEVQDRLLSQMIAFGIELPAHEPFDEDAEDLVYPHLIDAGWELLPLAKLDPERHRGAIEAYGEPILFDAARFEEENAEPSVVMLQELPILGPVELLRGVDADGVLKQPLVLWTEGDEVYQDYVLRGVQKAAKL